MLTTSNNRAFTSRLRLTCWFWFLQNIKQIIKNFYYNVPLLDFSFPQHKGNTMYFVKAGLLIDTDKQFQQHILVWLHYI